MTEHDDAIAHPGDPDGEDIVLVETRQELDELPDALTPTTTPPPAEILRRNIHGRVPDHQAIYRSMDGKKILLVMLRWNRRAGEEWQGNEGRSKDIRALTPWRSGWRYKQHPPPRPLYGLDLLAARPDAPVLIVEGEVKAERARALLPDFVVITWPGGAMAIMNVEFSPLKGRRVTIWRDADTAGASAELKLIDCLIDIAADIRTVNLDDVAAALGGPLPPGWDIADAPSGWTAETVQPILCAAIPAARTDTASPGSLTISPTLARMAEDHLNRPIDQCDSDHAAIVVGVLDRLQRQAVSIDALGSMRNVANGERSGLDLSTLATELAFELRRDGQRVDVGRIIETASVLIQRDAKVRRHTIYSALLGRPGTDPGKLEVRKFIRAVTGQERESDVQALMHWLWLVKTRAAGHHGQMHLMLCLVGNLQGSGKSTAAMKLCAPWQELFDPDISLVAITDDRCAPHLAKCVVGLWDELGGLARADMEMLKHRITAPDVSYRPMRTTDRVVLPNLMTLIGTSNRSLAELVKDGSGMRRFFEIAVPGQCDWEAINSIDYNLLWTAVSEDDVAPGIIHRDMIAREQEKLTWKHPVVRWLDDESWSPLIDLDGGPLPSVDPTAGAITVDLLKRHRVWCKANGERECSSADLGRQLTALGWVPFRSPRSSNQKPGYRRLPIRDHHPAQSAHPCTPPTVMSGSVQSALGVQGELPLSSEQSDEVIL